MGRKFWLAVVAQLLVLLGMVAWHSFTLLTGSPVTLRATAWGPWESQRGAYVHLTYDIAALRVDEVTMDSFPYTNGEQVWVTLQQGVQPGWRAVAVSRAKPAVAEGQVALRGRVGWSEEPWEGPDAKMPGRVHLHYGIEQFFMPEGQGSGRPDGQVELVVGVKVDRFGRAAISQVLLDGRPIEWR